MSFGPPPGGFPPPPPAAWTPPSEVEQALFEAKLREDWAAYFGTLAQSRLFFEIQKDKADATPSATYAVFGYDPRVAGGRIWAVYTEGMLPAPEPHRVFGWNYLEWFAKVWQPTDPPMIVVNPGSPCEAFLPSAPPHSAAWARYGEQAPPQNRSMRLRTLRVGGPLHGPVAHSLACGALLCVNNGSFWNAMAWHGTGYPGERKRLREWWGITTREQWQYYLRDLLACEQHSSVWDFALGLRRTIARDFGGHVDAGYWRQAAAEVIRARSEGSVVVGEDGVTKTEPRPQSEVEAHVEGVQRLIGRITRYEARMRADGVLDGNRYVSSVDAWDLGRASKMARWGLGARLGTLQEAEAAVLQAGRAAALSYKSWQDFSAGYILGRCLHFDDEEFGDWYQDMVKAHHILVSDPGSPWLTIPFR
ncbi:DUF1266 domain-containing protein [Streptomyces cinerochromogenes]|uniref:DUF1266 domain-containing protein n=1 Tax=Streptomyces cinerochromogenes TaxID=66422 RepID=UPI0016710453|nr:DUF1266 domain-containing protein [Streptomyces cinerochromogenes]GGS78750.1 hypothetical protein GCM10010206_46490 [Streptomyces cinerochromogenes]